MRERPILFSGPMVKAILAGAKTQTRRVVPEPRAAKLYGRRSDPSRHFADPGLGDGPYLHWFYTGGDIGDDAQAVRVDCKYGAVGDRLWVRETWYDDFERKPGEAHELNTDRFDDGRVEGIEYRASHDCASFEAGCPCNPDGDGKRSEWRPSIYMPRWASRLTLEITGVRLQRLQEITDEDAKAEGVTPLGSIGADQPILDTPRRGRTQGSDPHVLAFGVLWDTINADRGFPWVSNPFVWAVRFRLVESQEKA